MSVPDELPPPAPFSLWRSLVKGLAALALGFVALVALLFSSCGILVGSMGWLGGQGGAVVVAASLAVFGLVVVVLRRLFR